MTKAIRSAAIAVLVVCSIASPATADTTSRTLLSRALANGLYCQLNGCNIVGASSINANWTIGSSGFLRWGSSGVATPDLFVSRQGAAAIQLGVNSATPVANTIYGAPSSRAGTDTDVLGANFLLRPGNGTGTGGSGLLVFATATPGTTGTAADVYANAMVITNRQQTVVQGNGLRPDANVFFVAADFTSASSTALQTITGLSWTLPALTTATYAFHCEILYNQTVAAVADAFGIQAANLAPLNIAAQGWVGTSAAAVTLSNMPTLATTTATNIVTFTPSAITTVWNARLSGFIENPNGVANTINIQVSQSTAADLMVIKRGSYCVLGF